MTWRHHLIALPWIIAAGCGTLSNGPMGSPQTASRVAEQLAPHLVFLHVERSSRETSTERLPHMLFTDANQTSATLVGVIVTTEGHVLTTALFDASPDLRIRAFLGDREMRARVRGSDKSLGLTLLQLSGDGPYNPLPASNGALPLPGEWLVASIPTDETLDFVRHTLLVNVRGEAPGHVRGYYVSDHGRALRGAPVANLRGTLVGLASSQVVYLWEELRPHVDELIERSLTRGEDRKEEEGKAWLGVLLHSVNKDLARLRGWPTASLLAGHVEPGYAADKAGLRSGDLIIGLNGKPLRFSDQRTREFFQQAIRPRVGRPFELTILRDGDQMTISGAMEKLPDPERLLVEELGLTVEAITPLDMVDKSLATSEGVRVTELQKGGAAANSGSLGRSLLMVDDVIVAVGTRPTPTLDAFREAATALRREKPEAVAIQYWRGRVSGFAGLNLKSSQKQQGDTP